MMEQKRHLTLAPKDAGDVVRTLSGSGQDMTELGRTALARAEYESGVGKGRHRLRIDTSYLSRFDGTDYCQWFGRVASGYFVPFGRIMQIVCTPPTQEAS